jgi:hypothetical protein
MADNEQQQPDKKQVKGYGKRPFWQWAVIYLVVAVIVYGLVYYIFINNGDSNGTGGLGY